MAYMYVLYAFVEFDMRVIANAIPRVRSRSQPGWPGDRQGQHWTLCPKTCQNRATKYDPSLQYLLHSRSLILV